MAGDALQKILDYAEAIEQSRSVSESLEAIARVLADFGIENFALSGMVQTAASVPEAVMAWRYPKELFEIYADQRLFDADPAMRLLRHTSLPFHWRDVPRYPDQEPRASVLRGLVEDFGITNGLFIPIHAATGNRGNVWVAGEKFEGQGAGKFALSLIACHAFDHIESRIGPRPVPRSPLTQREKEVLTWTALGKTAWEISEILNITVRTVNEYAQSARHKLGATNRAHMVAIALRSRFIDP